MHQKNHLPELDGICLDMLECNRFLLLDRILEDADVLGILNLDGKNRIRVVAVHQTVELEDAISRLWLVRRDCDR